MNPITLAISTVLNFLLSSGAHVALVAIVVYVVLGDHAGRTIENTWTVVKRSFWRLLGTDVAQSLVTLLLTLLLSGIVGVVGGVISGVFFKGGQRRYLFHHSGCVHQLIIWVWLQSWVTFVNI